MIFKFIRRDVYGRPLYFPACELSQMLLDAFPHMTGARKSLSDKQVQILRKMGLEIELVVQVF